jgi:hypothetical protein
VLLVLQVQRVLLLAQQVLPVRQAQLQQLQVQQDQQALPLWSQALQVQQVQLALLVQPDRKAQQFQLRVHLIPWERCKQHTQQVPLAMDT